MVELRRCPQRPLVPVEALRIAILIGNLHEIPLRVERPGVVEALEHPRITRVLTADRRAPMGARVEEHAHLPVVAANEDDRLAADLATNEVARVRDLRFVPDVEPAPFEDVLALELEDLLGGQRRAVHAEQAAFPVVDHQRRDFRCFHLTYLLIDADRPESGRSPYTRARCRAISHSRDAIDRGWQIKRCLASGNTRSAIAATPSAGGMLVPIHAAVRMAPASADAAISPSEDCS